MQHHLHLFRFKDMSKFEILITLIVMIEPITAIPQVLKIFSLKSAEEFFIWRWVFGFSTALLMMIYGLRIKKPPIFIGAAMWSLVHGSMVIAILIYG